MSLPADCTVDTAKRELQQHLLNQEMEVSFDSLQLLSHEGEDYGLQYQVILKLASMLPFCCRRERGGIVGRAKIFYCGPHREEGTMQLPGIAKLL